MTDELSPNQPTGDQPSGARNVWLIGGLQFVPPRPQESCRGFGDDYEAVALDHGAEVWPILLAHRGFPTEFSPGARDVIEPLLRPAEAVQDAVSRVLLEVGRVPLHAALVMPKTQGPGLLILGDSGQGKSSLAWLAVSMGWRVVSDDLVALRVLETGATVGTTVRKRLRIPAHLVDARTRSLGRKMRNHEGLQKIRLDPEALRPGSFLREARIGRIAFLERADSRSVRAVSRTEALERLLSVCSQALAFSRSRAPFQILSDLARQADARVARLTQECLSDPRVLDELAS